jgi:hypothetical protein
VADCVRKYFSTPAGHKPPPEQKKEAEKDVEKEDVEMSTGLLVRG